MGSFLNRFVRFEPAPGVAYPRSLRIEDPSFSPLRQIALGIGGAMLVLMLLWTIPAVVTRSALGLFYLISGSPGDWATYVAAAATFAIPAGMAAAQLGLAAMIPVTLALVLFVNRFRPRWLHSVQPGFRWRYALLALVAAVVVIGGVWALSRIGQEWTFRPEADWGWFLLVIVLVTPLQAAGEEYVFRGYLMQAISSTAVDLRPIDVGKDGPMAKVGDWLAKEFPSWAGIAGSAIIFTLMHPSQNLPALLYPLGFGLLAGWLVVKTGGLEASIAAHVVNNVITFGYATMSGTMVATYTQRSVDWLGLVITLGSFALFAVAAIWLAKRMKLATTTPVSRF
ncbi:CPBP family intramembrane glutamic endopeptidase [Propionicimonas sp.]|uniref:CPBP family intramembrane glutamic endopeptidase n=1 Tax=Propionicimonas sp. TaxID=1955623 RepID=UPI00180E1903|nr:CPBP family intramembrane glutamic endopeptidase [Propionicimonas sp.]MBU3977204.1 CPBP family intramembrane metalloprotease [Actinomycetota bacterium]MBA3021130.1 CPBP family intramembrane metalloprotease [Propionicimonas sp.]MBU3985714.1 CPBP family intramembrane metalloprotease [Actinomycetota bacterium]MBU4008499.1 CPBP family intramembrane metalloprotease [Actinomycetota bacterium]MBU4066351.1 CPBP family intramembrane metalloprotease [Actinomycetota bacterium]